jgi:hypothetical protein
MPTSRGGALRWSLALALAAHLGLFVSVGGPRPARPVPTVAQAEIEVQVEAPLPAPVAPPPEPPSEAPSPEPAKLQPQVASAAHLEPRRTGATSAEVAGAASAAPSAEVPASDGTWTFSATAGASTGGGGAGDAGLAPGALAAATRAGVNATLSAQEAAAPKRSILPTYTGQDLSLGLAPGGQYVSVTRDAVRTSLAPEIGHALLEFRTDGAGALVSVHVVNASSDPGAWEEVARDLAAGASRFHTERVPSGRNGLSVLLEVTSERKTLSGETPSDDNALKAIYGAITDPLDKLVDSKGTTRRVVAARVVSVHPL